MAQAVLTVLAKSINRSIKPSMILSSQQAIPCQRANGAGTLRISHTNSLARQTIDMRRCHSGLVVVATHIAVPHVICRDQHNIRSVIWLSTELQSTHEVRIRGPTCLTI